jgi:hypothetical protein
MIRSAKSILDSLEPGEKAEVLEALLRMRPELREDAEKLAHGLLIDVDPDAVADAVEWDVRGLSIDELNGRAGRQRGGYVEPTQAAWDLLGETVEPHAREVKRLLTLGLVEQAVATALGVVAGLYRCRDCEDGDLLLSWAPDFPAEEARTLVKELVKAGCEVPAQSLADSAAEWVDWLGSGGGAGP